MHDGVVWVEKSQEKNILIIIIKRNCCTIMHPFRDPTGLRYHKIPLYPDTKDKLFNNGFSWGTLNEDQRYHSNLNNIISRTCGYCYCGCSFNTG